MPTPDIEYCLSNLKPFTSGTGKFRAFEGQLNGDLGRLPEAWAERYCVDTRLFRVSYTVMSYDTPIAWVLSDVDGDVHEIVIPNVRYGTITASEHQSPCRRLLPFPDKHVTEL